MSRLDTVIKALNVQRVVWIDDMFSIGVEVVGDVTEIGSRVLDDGLLNRIGLDRISGLDPDEQLEALVAELQANPETLAMARNALTIDNDAANARALLNGISCESDATTGQSWLTTLKNGEMVYNRTLFLVDRDFKKEGISEQDSADLLRNTMSSYVAENESNYCVVLTQEVSESDEDVSRCQLIEQVLGAAVDAETLVRFSVIAKQVLGGQTAEAALSRKLRDKLAGVVLYKLLKHLEKSFAGSVEGLRTLFATEFASIDQAVLCNSYEEGASEIDVLVRILQQKQRLLLAKDLSEDATKIKDTLRRFRLFQIETEEAVRDDSVKLSDELVKLCKAEVLSSGGLINELLLPVVPGDVFEECPVEVMKDMTASTRADTLEVGKSYWMLVGQLCDMVPRGNTGQSSSNMAFLVSFEVRAVKGHEKNQDRNQIHSGRISWMTAIDIALHFDFRKVLSTSVSSLQFCAFNPSGWAELKEGDADELWSLPSLARMRRLLLERLTEDEIPEDLLQYAVSFQAEDSGKRIDVDGLAGQKVFRYPVRRVCRIRELEASEALGALERYWRRPAKPHNFVN